jgi:integral membrane sensor domain MASE1
MIKFIQYNLIALSSVFFARSLIIPMDHFNSNLGNTLWLPMGAVLLAFLLFGFRVFPGLLLGYLLAEIFIEGGTSNIGQHELISRTVNTLVPLLIILLMQKLNIADFIKNQQLNFWHLAPLIVVASVATTLTKVALLYLPNQFSAGKVYFQSYVQGDIIGAFVFIIIVFFMAKFTLIQSKII